MVSDFLAGSEFSGGWRIFDWFEIFLRVRFFGGYNIFSGKWGFYRWVVGCSEGIAVFSRGGRDFLKVGLDYSWEEGRWVCQGDYELSRRVIKKCIALNFFKKIDLLIIEYLAQLGCNNIICTRTSNIFVC